MTRDEEGRERTVKLFLECETKRAEARTAALAKRISEHEASEIAHEAAKEHWNAWAEKLLEKRKVLEVSGKWTAKKTPSGSFEPKNAETLAWIDEATVNFSRCHFILMRDKGAEATSEEDKNAGDPEMTPIKPIAIAGTVADFRGFIFPGDAKFERAKFHGHAWFMGATFSSYAWFESVCFRGDAWFRSVIFVGYAQFDNARFWGGTLFASATFSGEARFANAHFKGCASFNGDVIFSGAARFSGVTFLDASSFDTAIFQGPVWFSKATFEGDACFDSATFSKSTSFRDAKFGLIHNGREADFDAIKVERGFDLGGTYFSKLPSFCQADFKQAPDLDGVDFPLPAAKPLMSGDKDLIPKYRALRRMAIQSADYEREHKAFKGELRSRRWRIDKWWHPSAWLGVLYDGIADCGRSITQPAIAWAVTIIVFAAFYGSRASAGAEVRCADGGGAFIQALYLSLKNGLVLFAGTRDARVNQAYGCLYNGSPEQPHIPASVTFVETLGQVPISAVLIFLVLLAVKNRFKIK